MNTSRSARFPLPTRVAIVRGGVLLAGLSLLGTARGSAQDLPQELTLERAIEIAEQLSPDYRIAANELETAEQDVRQARANTFIPRFEADLASVGTLRRNFETENFFGQPLDEPVTDRWWSTSMDQSLTVQLPLFDIGNIRQLRGSNASFTSAEAAFDAGVFNLRSNVVSQYYAALQAEDAVALERELVASAEQNLERQKRLFNIVSAQQEDILGAELELLSRQNSLDGAIGRARKARLELLQTLGVRGERQFELVDRLPEPFDPALLDAAALSAQAANGSPRMRRAETTVDAAEAQLGVARADRWPTISLSGRIGRQRTTREDHEAFYDLNPQNWGYNVGVILNIPVSLFRIHSSPQRVRAELTYDNAQEELRAERIAIEREVRDALIDLEQMYRNIDLADRTVEIAAERVRLTEERMRAAGGGSFFELDQLRERLAQSEREALDARFSFQNSLLALEEIVGRKVQP